MRVLVIANNFPWPEHPFDGMFNLRALLALRERGHDVRVIRCVPWSPPLQKRWQRYRTVPDRYDVERIPVRTLRGLMGPSSWGIGTLALQMHARLADEIADFQPDVVHVHGLLPAGVLSLGIDRPVVVTAHGSETYSLPWQRPGLEKLGREVVARADALAAVSLFVASNLERLGGRDVAIVHNGADETVFYPRDRQTARARLGIGGSGPLVLFVGHQERDKGMVELVTALRALQDLDVGVAFAGKGSMQSWIASELESAKVPAIFLGSLAHERLADAYAACDLLVLPSYREGLPTVICEAMNAGRAVVATNVGGIPEIVTDRVTGRVVPARNADALTAALRDVLAVPGRAASMGEAGSAFARERLTWRHNARAYEAIYERIVKRVPALS